MIKTNGIGVSEGVVVGTALVLTDDSIEVEKKYIEDTSKEIELYHDAISKTVTQLDNLYIESKNRINEETAEIFSAHKLIADDPEIKSKVYHLINNEKICASFAVQQVTNEFADMFLNIGDEYFKERAADVMDVSNRIIKNIQGLSIVDLSTIDKEVIIVAHDLTPSETVQMNPEFVKGFATNIGGKTSHSAIIARQMGIPAVCGLVDVTTLVEDGGQVILDGDVGSVIINPDTKTISDYNKKHLLEKREKESLKEFKGKLTSTLDNQKFKLYANIGSSKQVEKALDDGAEGIGLFRTEFLYLDREQLPSEEVQFDEYKDVLEKMNGKSVVIRPLDIGGDKQLPYLNLPKELNPFLGKRAIRLCFDEIDIFKTQLRALLRASIYGNLKIMFPMIATIEEYREAKNIVMNVKTELQEEGHKVSEAIELGIMVEIPSVAISAELFAKEVDFFSIGTNDLIQYTFAADRMNQELSHLYQPLHPSILRLIELVVKAANKYNKWVGLCGELSSDIEAIPLLVALGVEELSMTSTNILKTRKLISKLNKSELLAILEKAKDSSSYEDVRNIVMEDLKWKELLK